MFAFGLKILLGGRLDCVAIAGPGVTLLVEEGGVTTAVALSVDGGFVVVGAFVFVAAGGLTTVFVVAGGFVIVSAGGFTTVLVPLSDGVVLGSEVELELEGGLVLTLELIVELGGEFVFVELLDELLFPFILALFDVFEVATPFPLV